MSIETGNQQHVRMVAPAANSSSGACELREVRRLAPADLTAEHFELWRAALKENPELDSPFFQPGFTTAVAAVRRDVEIAVGKTTGGDTVFFPYQRSAFHIGRPVGGRLSCFQGLISRRPLRIDPYLLLKRVGLNAWDFDHLPLSQTTFASHNWSVENSPYIDLSSGFSAYQEQKRKAGSHQASKLAARGRKMAREVGELRFEWRTQDLQTLNLLMRWKSRQFQATGFADVFAFEWVRNLLTRIVAQPDDHFEEVLSVLYAGNRPAAICIDLRTDDVLHGWFTAFDPELSKYSPGALLTIKKIEAAAERGVKTFHLGKGEAPYKRSLMTHAIPLATGAVERQRIATTVRRGYRGARNWVRTSPFSSLADLPARIVRPVREWASFR